MNEEQFAQLLDTLHTIADGISQTYTLTGAADWPILAVMVGLMVVMVGFMWNDLKSAIKDSDTLIKQELEKEVVERKEQDNHIWAAMRHCQEDCCLKERTETR